MHAWDHPEPNTYVIISNDRDVGYAVSTLRMRRFPVIVVSSISAHADLTAHASTRLDLAKSLLGINGDFTQPANFADAKPTSSQFPDSSFSFRQQEPGREGTLGSQFRKAAFTGTQKLLSRYIPNYWNCTISPLLRAVVDPEATPYSRATTLINLMVLVHFLKIL